MNIFSKNQKLAASVMHSVTAKTFVKKPLILALAAITLSATAVPAFATDWWSAKPDVVIGKTATVDVRTKGALGDGVHDDTAAIQAAIDSLPSDGGTVTVPAGRYMINALKPIRLRSHTRLLMDSMATLAAIPTSASRYWVIKVWNVTDVRIVGGNVVGERAQHKGSTGEWGYGINISGSKNVVVKAVNVSDFWGDGVLVGATGSGRYLQPSDNVTIDRVVSSNNRRQGLTIGPSQHVYIFNSTFQGSRGTLPEAGIDIEPQDQGPVSTVRLENNTFADNHGNGIELHANISDITITGNTLTGNHGFGMLAISAPYLTITNNNGNKNGLAAVGVSGTTHNVSITGNTLQWNSTRYMSPTKSGGALDRDLQIGTSTSAISVSGNVFSNPKYNTYTR